MGYNFKNGNHLFNYCRKVINSKNFIDKIDEQQLLDSCNRIYNFTNEYKKEILSRCLRKPASVFTYNVVQIDDYEEMAMYITHIGIQISMFRALFKKEVKEILENAKIYDKYVDKSLAAKNPSYYLKYCRDNDIKASLNYNFIMDASNLVNEPGIYKLYDINKKLIYVGKSYDLSSRLISSAQSKPAQYYSYTKIKSKADTDIYELYYIQKEKPDWNTDCKNEDELTIILPELKFTELRLIYSEEEIEMY